MAGWLLRVLVLIGLPVILGGVVACGRGSPPGAAPKSGPLKVVVSIAPLRWVVAALPRIDGKEAEVALLVPVGALEHGYEIPPAMVAKVLDADVVVYVGLGIEPGLEKLLREHPSPSRREVCFAEVVGSNAEEKGHGENTHADHEGHDHAGVDPHLWLDPQLVRKLIPAVRDAVEKAVQLRGLTLSPEAQNELVGAERNLMQRALRMDDWYFRTLGPLQGRPLITAHAAWGRLTERYGLLQVPLAGLEATEPSPAQLARAVESIRAHGATTIFIEPQMSDASARRLAESTGARLATLDPLGDGDWYGMMGKNLDEIARGLGGTAPSDYERSARPAGSDRP